MDKILRQMELLHTSFKAITQKHLHTNKSLDNAPFAVLSHGTGSDPIFNYANKAALELFEYSLEDLITLPSRLSAEAMVQSERDRLLARVSQFGYVDDYKGVRVSKSGKRFQIDKAIVWNVIDAQGNYQGQAAVLYEWHQIKPYK
ncbi:MEKHLA domain-containing protein [Paraferrimonas sp. SM1919]|uniref:MEKHLA domain-containing protein n=1 Tax=Paraferrimonas sp. SM1919 TaxID=2662263 RepID=UPI0013D10BB0|nr:MEKHLA domain-containing protein [Paraferrimonas sp. SM1919]